MDEQANKMRKGSTSISSFLFQIKIQTPTLLGNPGKVLSSLQASLPICGGKLLSYNSYFISLPPIFYTYHIGFFFFLFKAKGAAYGSLQARDPVEAVAATSATYSTAQGNTRFLTSLSETRDQT